jgi:hypothetical protein
MCHDTGAIHRPVACLYSVHIARQLIAVCWRQTVLFVGHLGSDEQEADYLQLRFAHVLELETPYVLV